MQSDVPQYWLPHHVHVCLTPDGVVFLDLRRDRYFGFGGEQVRAMAAVVNQWPVSAVAARSGPISPERAVRIADLLVKEGLLTRDSNNGKSAAPIALDEPTMIAVGQHSTGHRAIRIGDIFRFLTACISASCALRWRPIESVVARAAWRKERHSAPSHEPDARTMTELVSVFHRMRRFAFTSRDQCLFHSLALINFLAHYNVFPTWVIGVKTAPWGAHSWVQQGNRVLDSTPEAVSAYTPILSI